MAAKKNVNPSYITGKQLPASYFSGMGKGAKSSGLVKSAAKALMPKISKLKNTVPMRSGSPTKKGVNMISKAVKKLAM